jgi:hypothetical protein
MHRHLLDLWIANGFRIGGMISPAPSAFAFWPGDAVGHCRSMSFIVSHYSTAHPFKQITSQWLRKCIGNIIRTRNQMKGDDPLAYCMGKSRDSLRAAQATGAFEY